MSTNTDIITKPIEIKLPELNDSFAGNLEAVFNNINTNFEMLANSDFIKGEKGDSVTVKDMALYENGKYTDIGILIREAIESQWKGVESSAGNITYTSGGTQINLTVWDNFNSADNSIKLVYCDDELVSSLYYVFYDGRFVNNKMNNIDKTLYADKIDYSCIVVYEKDKQTEPGGFKVLSNAFPTMYYDTNSGLCWKLHGNNTGLPVQGIPGKDGKNAMMYLVKTDKNSNNQGTTDEKGTLTIKVSQIFDGNMYINATDESIVNNPAAYDGAGAIIIEDINVEDPDHPEKKNNSTVVYFGVLKFIKGELCAVYNKDFNIKSELLYDHVNDFMRSINFNNVGSSNYNAGLFIPIITGFDKQDVHLLTATSITNNMGDNINPATDLILTPVNDIDTIINGNMDNTNTLNVGRTITMKFDENQNQLTSIKAFFESNDKTSDFADSDDFNNTVKSIELTYTLADFIPKYDNIVESDTPVIVDTNSYDNVYYGEHGNNTIENTLHRHNAFYTVLTDSNKNTGIYKWVLAKKDAGYNISGNNLTDDICEHINKFFGVLYTTSTAVTNKTEILWFNGIEYEVYDEEQQEPTEGVEASAEDLTYIIIPGWEIVDLLKYVSSDIKLNSNIETDTYSTSLNIINYDINVISKADSARNVIVDGTVDSKNIITGTLYADTIDKVNTNKCINAAGGIDISITGGEQDDLVFNVNEKGVTTNLPINTTKPISVEVGTTKDVALVDTTKDVALNVSYTGSDNASNKFEVSDTTKIEHPKVSIIVGGDNLIDIKQNINSGCIVSNTPLIKHTNAGIVVSNMDYSDNKNQYFRVGADSNMIFDTDDTDDTDGPNSSNNYYGGEGVSGVADNINANVSTNHFINAKNFNIQRQYVGAYASYTNVLLKVNNSPLYTYDHKLNDLQDPNTQPSNAVQSVINNELSKFNEYDKKPYVGNTNLEGHCEYFMNSDDWTSLSAGGRTYHTRSMNTHINTSGGDPNSIFSSSITESTTSTAVGAVLLNTIHKFPLFSLKYNIAFGGSPISPNIPQIVGVDILPYRLATVGEFSIAYNKDVMSNTDGSTNYKNSFYTFSTVVRGRRYSGAWPALIDWGSILRMGIFSIKCNTSMTSTESRTLFDNITNVLQYGHKRTDLIDADNAYKDIKKTAYELLNKFDDCKISFFTQAGDTGQEVLDTNLYKTQRFGISNKYSSVDNLKTKWGGYSYNNIGLANEYDNNFRFVANVFQPVDVKFKVSDILLVEYSKTKGTAFTLADRCNHLNLATYINNLAKNGYISILFIAHDHYTSIDTIKHGSERNIRCFSGITTTKVRPLNANFRKFKMPDSRSGLGLWANTLRTTYEQNTICPIYDANYDYKPYSGLGVIGNTKTTENNTITCTIDDIEHTDKNMNDLFLDLSDTKKAELKLDIITNNNTVEDQRTTTICDDGIVFRDKNYVFGMGSGPYSTYNVTEDGKKLDFTVNDIGKVGGGTLNDSEPFMFMYENDAGNYNFNINEETTSNLLKYGMDNAGYDLYIRKFPLRKLFDIHDELNVIANGNNTLMDFVNNVVAKYVNTLKDNFDKKIEQANNELVTAVSTLQTELQNQQLAYTALVNRYDEQYTILNNRIDSFKPSITDSDTNPGDSGDSSNND